MSTYRWLESNGTLLMGENERSPTGRVDPVWGCVNNPSRLG
jgi:hypothetical protein